MQNEEVWAFLKMIRKSGLTYQQRKTIQGQALAGDLQGAKKGYERLMRRAERRQA